MTPISVPGLRTFREYRREWLANDLVAGLSVAAVAAPVGIAYAQIAGFRPEVGLYAATFPPVAYAFFGTSRQLIVNPDSATCAIIAATLAPLAADNPDRYSDLSFVLTIVAAILCVVGGLLRLGVIATFLSRPILAGYMNGIALSIIVGQLGRLFGFSVPSTGFFRMVANFVSRLDETHVATLAVGLSLFMVLWILRRVAPKIPAPLVVVAVAIAGAYFLNLEARGVAVVGPVPAGLPVPRLPTSVTASDLSQLFLDACGIVIVSFCSMMSTARGFAARNNYTVDANQDFIALGVSNVAAALGQGFIISGADSRTAVADAAGGRTQVTSLVAAAAMIAVLLFLTTPLRFLPSAALAAIVISSTLGLFNLAPIRHYYRLNRAEFYTSVIATLGVITLGVLPGILIAVGLALLRLIALVAHPDDAVLGIVDGLDGYASEAEGARRIPGLVIYRFEASILFFNADYFMERVRKTLAESDGVEWFLLDAGMALLLDITGAETLATLQGELAARGIVLAVARPRRLFFSMLERSGVLQRIGADHVFLTVREGVHGFLARVPPGPSSKRDTRER